MNTFHLDPHSVTTVAGAFLAIALEFEKEKNDFSDSIKPLAGDVVSCHNAQILEKHRHGLAGESYRSGLISMNVMEGLKQLLEQAHISDEQKAARFQAAFSGMPTSESNAQFHVTLNPVPASEHDSLIAYAHNTDGAHTKQLIKTVENSDPNIASVWDELSSRQVAREKTECDQISTELAKNSGETFTALGNKVAVFSQALAAHEHEMDTLRSIILENMTAFKMLKSSLPKLKDFEAAENRLNEAAKNKRDDEASQEEYQEALSDYKALIEQTHTAYSQYATQALNALPAPTTVPEIVSSGAGAGSGSGSGSEKDHSHDTDKDPHSETPGGPQDGQGSGQGGAPQGGQGGGQGGAPQGGQGGQPQGGGAPQGGSESGDKDDDKDSDDKDKDKDDDGKDSKHHHGLPGTHAASAHDKHTPHGGGGGGAGGSATPLSKASIPGAGGTSGAQPGVAPSTAAAAASGAQGPVGGPAGGMPGGARPGGSSGEKTRSNMFINKTKDDSWVDDEAFDVPIQHTGVADPNSQHPGSHDQQQNPNQDQPPRPKFRPGQRPPRNPSE